MIEVISAKCRSLQFISLSYLFLNREEQRDLRTNVEGFSHCMAGNFVFYGVAGQNDRHMYITLAKFSYFFF